MIQSCDVCDNDIVMLFQSQRKMLLLILFVLVSLPFSIGTQGLGSILDLEEVSSFRYSMKIEKDPVLASKDQVYTNISKFK